jgi:hypothetical protein
MQHEFAVDAIRPGRCLQGVGNERERVLLYRFEELADVAHHEHVRIEKECAVRVVEQPLDEVRLERNRELALIHAEREVAEVRHV